MEWPQVLGIVVEDYYERRGARSEAEKPRALEELECSVGRLRAAYNTSPGKVDYRDAAVREAYMIYYFPAYIRPMYRLLERLQQSVPGSLDALIRHRDPEITAFGCGPSPEVLGALAFLSHYGGGAESATAHLLDINRRGWAQARRMCFTKLAPLYWPGELARVGLTCDFLERCEACGGDCEERLWNSDIVLFQNFLNDLDPTSTEVATKAVQVAQQLRPGTLLLFVDVHYDTAWRRLQEMRSALSQGLAELLLDIEERYDATNVVLPVSLLGKLTAKSHVYYFSMALRKL